MPTQNSQSDSNFDRPIYSEAGTQWINGNGGLNDGLGDQNSENNQEISNAPDGASEATEQLLMMDSMMNEEPSCKFDLLFKRFHGREKFTTEY